jgi:hypothetical protein
VIPTPSSPQQDLYRPAFVHNCLLLLVRARNELAGVPLASEEEPVITGLLVKRARELTEMEDDADPLIEYLEILDDPPQNDDPVRLGKRRLRIDIEFVETRRGRRPRFHLEAKRLYRSDSVNQYLGHSGLGMFLTGAYASEWPSAGMLGYVQTESCSVWRTAIAQRLAALKAQINSCEDRPTLQSTGWSTSGLQDVQESCHRRMPEDLGRIAVYHLFLDFSSTTDMERSERLFAADK